jgi:hypothetical protein
LDFLCDIPGQHPGLKKYWLSSHYAGAAAIQQLMMLLIFSIHKVEVEMPFSCTGQSTSDEK